MDNDAEITTSPSPPDSAATAASAAAIEGGQGAPSAPRRSRWRIVWIALTTLVVGTLGLFAYYLWDVNEQWIAQNDLLRNERADLLEDLAQALQDIDDVTFNLTTTSDQLANAQALVNEVVGLEANTTDAMIILEDLAEAFVECISAQDEIIDAYRKGYPYSINREAVSARVEFCDAIIDSFDEFAKERHT